MSNDYRIGNGVKAIKNTLKQQDNAIASGSCCDCHKTIGRKEMYNYKGNRCSSCFHKFYIAEYDTSPNDSTARYLIKCGSDSAWWRYATAQQKSYTLKYFKTNGTPEPTIQEQMEVETYNNLDNL